MNIRYFLCMCIEENLDQLHQKYIFARKGFISLRVIISYMTFMNTKQILSLLMKGFYKDRHAVR